jgi:HAD domain in Swiss Army Knife RNA repair proteins
MAKQYSDGPLAARVWRLSCSAAALLYAEDVDDQRPILALDVDGVISLFGFERPPAESPGRFHLIDGMAHCIPDGIGERLSRIANHYEIIWATGWEDRANDRLPEILGLPGELPFLTFDGRASFGSAHWKIAAIDAYAGERPLAWVDDCIDETCQAWAVERSAPTLLVPTESDRGLTDAHVDALLRWVRAGYTA